MIDRKKDIFKHRGHHINPSEIENVIQAMDGIEFASVVPVPDSATYNLIAAVVKKKDGFEKLEEQNVVDFVANNLPDYKKLHGGAYFVDEFPMTASGKILKRDVKVIALQRYNEKLTKTG